MKLSAAKSANRFISLVFITLVFLLITSLAGNLLAWMRIDLSLIHI